jgi:hypothetical protein
LKEIRLLACAFNTTIEHEDATDSSIAFSVTMIERREVAFSLRCV